MSSASLTLDQLFSNLAVEKADVAAEVITKAKSGDGQALNDIGYYYQHKKREDEKAIAWYRLAADKDNPSGLNNLGFMYQNGKSVPRDYSTAMDLYLKAAKHGRKRAYFHLGEMFEAGQGVEVDRYKSLEWYRKYDPFSEEVKKLKNRGYHIAKHLKDKPTSQLIQETRAIMNGTRNEEEEYLRNLPRANSVRSQQPSYTRTNTYDQRSISSTTNNSNQEEIDTLRAINASTEREKMVLRDKTNLLQQQLTSLEEENRRLEIASLTLKNQFAELKDLNQTTEGDMKLMKQSYKILEQHLNDKDAVIASLKQENLSTQNASKSDQQSSKKAIEALEMLLDSKKTEVDLLKQNMQLLLIKDEKNTRRLEREIQRLKVELEKKHRRTKKNDSDNALNYDSASENDSENDLNYDSDSANPNNPFVKRSPEKKKKPVVDKVDENHQPEHDLNYDE